MSNSSKEGVVVRLENEQRRPGWVAGIGRGRVLEKLRFGAFRAKSAMPRHRPRRAPTAPHGSGALMALIKHTEKRTFGARSGSGPPGVGQDVL